MSDNFLLFEKYSFFEHGWSAGSSQLSILCWTTLFFLFRIENPEGGTISVCCVEKNLSVSRNDLSPSVGRITVNLCTCASVDLLRSFPPLSHRNVSSYSSWNPPWRMLPVRVPGRASFSRFHTRCAGSLFLQILHIFSTSTYAAFNFEAGSPERVTQHHFCDTSFLPFFNRQISSDYIICRNSCVFYKEKNEYTKRNILMGLSGFFTRHARNSFTIKES